MAKIEPKTRPVGPHIICASTLTSSTNDTTPNLLRQDNAENPHECHTFKYPIQYSENPQDGSIVKETWKISGDVPLDLSIDSSGTITGVIKILNDQDSTKAFVNNKDDKVKLDGSNWQNVGRPTCMFFDFIFEAWMEYTFINKDGVPIPYMSAPAPVKIRVIKSHSIDDYLAMRNYLKTGSSTVKAELEDIEVQHRFDINGKKYTYENFEQFIEDSPGNWPTCGREL